MSLKGGAGILEWLRADWPFDDQYGCEVRGDDEMFEVDWRGRGHFVHLEVELGNWSLTERFMDGHTGRVESGKGVDSAVEASRRFARRNLVRGAFAPSVPSVSSGGVLTGQAIREAVKSGKIFIHPWFPEHVGPNSVDLRLSRELLVYTDGYDRHQGLPVSRNHLLDMRKANETRSLRIPEDGLVLEPGVLYLGCTMERTASNFFIPKVEGRSSVGRLGIKVHLTAGFGDIGFDGRWTLEIEVVHPVRVYAGERICQVYFTTPHGEVRDLYKGRYQGDTGPVASRFSEQLDMPSTKDGSEG